MQQFVAQIPRGHNILIFSKSQTNDAARFYLAQTIENGWSRDTLVKVSVNNMLKAITASLLMEQVLAPNWKFKTKLSDEDKSAPGELKIRGLKEPSSKRVKDIS